MIEKSDQFEDSDNECSNIYDKDQIIEKTSVNMIDPFEELKSEVRILVQAEINKIHYERMTEKARRLTEDLISK